MDSFDYMVISPRLDDSVMVMFKIKTETKYKIATAVIIAIMFGLLSMLYFSIVTIY